MTPQPLTIRPLQTIAEFDACEELQKLAWDAEQASVVPTHMLLTIAKSGGLCLGAFDRQGELLGFVFGILARRQPPSQGLRHHSHMLGVHPDWWGQGIGYRLKLAQRDTVLAQGLDLVTWTFDPLERRNASLNFGKLGVVCATYQVDLYGDMREGLNLGLPSDRFQAEWWLSSGRVRRRLGGERPAVDVAALTAGGALLNPSRFGADGLPHPADPPARLEGEHLLVEVPADVQALKRANLALAQAWRQTTRAIFRAAFEQGYRAIEYVYQDPCSYYLLQRDSCSVSRDS